ncbi:hypothetical protein [Sulfobacillus thermosulfidooxidans]|uniref:hypothetical protein n=1 Tax=Sulfobacillus thermosulfidooxidans TaxID=28034 RepID=UPI00036864E2|nr:hypothetical protein [Sulfobacillus thermosulfidooxidans]
MNSPESIKRTFFYQTRWLLKNHRFYYTSFVMPLGLAGSYAAYHGFDNKFTWLILLILSVTMSSVYHGVFLGHADRMTGTLELLVASPMPFLYYLLLRATAISFWSQLLAWGGVIIVLGVRGFIIGVLSIIGGISFAAWLAMVGAKIKNTMGFQSVTAFIPLIFAYASDHYALWPPFRWITYLLPWTALWGLVKAWSIKDCLESFGSSILLFGLYIVLGKHFLKKVVD